jgi:ATP-dependent Clp protease protease subunit
LDANPESGDAGERLIVICEPITSTLAMRVTMDLLRYEAAHPGVPIHMQLFSPGGCVVSGLAIIDTMNHITSPVFTYSIGYAASMAAVILACGKKDHRYILPHSRVMIHQASGSAGGTLENVRATLAYQNELENDCDEILARVTGRNIAAIREASRVDNWMRAEAARDFGLVDHLLEAAPLPFIL